MNELLIEIFSEEIPARMQLGAKSQAQSLFNKILGFHSAIYQTIETFIGPQRLTVKVDGLEPYTLEKLLTKRGPKVGTVGPAILGFAKATGQPQEFWDQREGYWHAKLSQPPQKIEGLLPEIIHTFLDQFSWPKSMRWYNPETNSFTRSWVRPIRSILCVYNEQPIKFKISHLNIVTDNKTYGHRFLAPQPIKVKNFSDYKQHLKDSFVILDHQERQQKIQQDLNEKASKHNLKTQLNLNLLEEVAGLVDYPFVHLGKIDSQFMHLPAEVLSTSMRIHQKYFSLLKDETLASYFGVVTNINPSSPHLEEMLEGYEKVLKARLSDAVFFYETDRKQSLKKLVPKLNHIIFHTQLGTLGQKIERLQNLMSTEQGKRAALLCKSDLLTQMVGEFPELQGIMGKIYAIENGESQEVALALKEYYQPLGPNEQCPTKPLSIELALVDKIDTLVGFLGKDIKPTGSKDPFGLRRAALGIIRLLLNHPHSNFDLLSLVKQVIELYGNQSINLSNNTQAIFIEFINDKLEGYLLAQNITCAKSVLSTNKTFSFYNVYSLYERSCVLQDFLKTPSGIALKTAYRRAAGVLDKNSIQQEMNPELLEAGSEKNLYHQVQDLLKSFHYLLKAHEYKTLMEHLAQLQKPIDDFFTDVRVNCEDQELRNNRYALLHLFVQAVNQIADFSQLQN